MLFCCFIPESLWLTLPLQAYCHKLGGVHPLEYYRTKQRVPVSACIDIQINMCALCFNRQTYYKYMYPSFGTRKKLQCCQTYSFIIKLHYASHNKNYHSEFVYLCAIMIQLSEQNRTVSLLISDHIHDIEIQCQ